MCEVVVAEAMSEVAGCSVVCIMESEVTEDVYDVSGAFVKPELGVSGCMCTVTGSSWRRYDTVEVYGLPGCMCDVAGRSGQLSRCTSVVSQGVLSGGHLCVTKGSEVTDVRMRGSSDSSVD